MLTRVSGSSEGENGSLAPLGIGLAVISLSAVLAILASGSLYLTERRLTSVAESTALAVLADAQGNLNQPLEPLANSYLSQIAPPGIQDMVLVTASADDSKTVKIRICSKWLPIFGNYIFSDTGRVCSEAFARLGR